MRHPVIFLAFLILLVGGCTVYMPQPVPIPLMTAKNQVQLSGGVTIIPGLTAAAAYSPVSHLAIQVYGFKAPDEINYYQAAAGYYWENSSDLNLELYGGIGNGQGKVIRTSDPSSLKGTHMVYFAQFNLGQTNQGNKHIDYGAGLKTGLFDATITDNGYFESSGPDPVLSHNKYILLEPAAFIRLGSERLKAGFQMNGTSFISIRSKQKQIPYYTVTLGISLNYLFQVKKLK